MRAGVGDGSRLFSMSYPTGTELELYERDGLRKRAELILMRVQAHVQNGSKNSQFIIDGIHAARHLLALEFETKWADKFEKDNETIQWEGDNPPWRDYPDNSVTRRLATAMYWKRRRSGKFGQYGKLESPCHICGGTNTEDAVVEENPEGVKVSYVGCSDCEMVIGDC